MEDLTYEERLEKIKLTTLVEISERGDLITIYKLLKGICLNDTKMLSFSREVYMLGMD